MANSLAMASIIFCSQGSFVKLTEHLACTAIQDPALQKPLCFTRNQWSEILSKMKTSGTCVKLSVKPPRRDRHLVGGWRPSRAELSQVEIWQVRLESARDVISARLQKRDYGGLFRKLILNETTQEGRDLEYLRKIGIVHVFSVTGIHLYALADTLRLLTSQILSGRSYSKLVSNFMALLVWIFTWALAGGRLGLLRPFILVNLRSASASLGFRWRGYYPLAFSVGIDIAYCLSKSLASHELVLNPYSIFYGLAVGGGLLGMDWAKSKTNHWKSPYLRHTVGHVAMSIGSWLATIPFEVWHAPTVPWQTPIHSLITIPLFVQVLFPIVILFSLLPQNLIDPWHSALVHFGNHALEVIGIFSSQFFPLVFISPMEFSLIFLIAMAVALGVQKKIHRAAAYIFFISIFFIIPKAHDHSDEVRQIDVGQGDLAFIRSQEYGTGVIDAGERFSSGTGKWIDRLGQALRSRDTLDWVILSHWDSDHVMGAWELARVAKVNCLISLPPVKPESVALLNFFQTHGTRIVGVQESSKCTSLPMAYNYHSLDRRNESMIGVAIPFGENRDSIYLNLGDADKKTELILWNQLKKNIKAAPRIADKFKSRILKLSHHGSRTSSHPGVLKEMNPTLAWISCGKDNQFRHPSIEVLHDVSHTEIQRTDIDGDLRFSNQAFHQ